MGQRFPWKAIEAPNETWLSGVWLVADNDENVSHVFETGDAENLAKFVVTLSENNDPRMNLGEEEIYKLWLEGI